MAQDLNTANYTYIKNGDVMNKAVVLLSGGLDSTTCLAYALAEGYHCHALTFNYGQRHHAELAAAQRIAQHYGVKTHEFPLNLDQFKGSALTDESLDVPDYDPEATTIPITYVPARNTIFLSIALALAEVVEAKNIFIGVSAIDYSGYPDCRPEYIQSFEQMANLATKSGVTSGNLSIHTPLIHLTKAQTIQLGLKLGVEYRHTVSCYRADAKGAACGRCDSCMLRKKGFADACVADQTIYQHGV